MLLLESLIFQESPESIEGFFNSLGQEEEVVKTMRPTASKNIVKGKAAKRLFSKFADKRFMDSLITIHWSPNPERILKLLKSPSNSEISCNAVLPGNIPQEGEWGSYGLVVKGHVTFLANDMDDVYSGSYSDYLPGHPFAYFGKWGYSDQKEEELAWYNNFLAQRQKTSGINKGMEGGLKSIVLDKEDFKQSSKNEALVDHWRVLAVIVPDDREKEFVEQETRFFVGTPHEVETYLRTQTR
jgi:hypothetical protein